MIVFQNGNWKKAEETKLSPFDHGFLYADAVYETLLVYNQKVFFVEEHWNRLQNSLNAMQMSLPSEYSLEYFADLCHTLVQKNELKNARLRITISRGENHFDFTSCHNPTIFASLSPLPHYPAEIFSEGVFAISKNAIRISPSIKHTNFLSGILLRQKMHNANAFEAIYKTSEGFLREGSISNIFAISNEAKEMWISPREEVLPGTMQAFLEKIFEQHGYTVIEKNFTEEDLLTHAAGLFISNSLMGIVPIKTLNESQLTIIPLFFKNIYELLDSKI